MTDLSILEQCLLTCDAPETVWRPALDSLRDDLEQARKDNLSAFDLLSRVRLALGDNGKRMQDELLAYCRGLITALKKIESQPEDCLRNTCQTIAREFLNR